MQKVEARKRRRQLVVEKVELTQKSATRRDVPFMSMTSGLTVLSLQCPISAIQLLERASQF
jgi:hypothetical protein